jgi:hypothetical protein
MSDTDQVIRDSLDRLAGDEHSDAPSTWEHLVRRRRRRQTRRIVTAAAAVLVVLGVGAAAVQLVDSSTETNDDVAQELPPDPDPGEEPPGGELSPGGEVIGASCVSTYSPATLAERSFAFDGTVREAAVVPAETEGDLEVTLAEFEVHAWYAGGDGETVTVQMQRPVVVGERLLVAGEPRWGGAPLDDAIAWECGFTSAYTAERADEWAEAVTGG